MEIDKIVQLLFLCPSVVISRHEIPGRILLEFNLTNHTRNA